MQNPSSLEEIAIYKEKCRRDPLFLAEALGYDFQPDVHPEMFAQLLRNDGVKPSDPAKKQLFDLSETKNRLVLWPRGHFKTSMVVVAIVQLILNYPDIRIMIMQANLKLTKGWLHEIKSHFNGINPKSKLPVYFKDFCAAQMGSAMAFTVPARIRKTLKEATVTCASPKAVQTGQHYDAFFADDLVHTGNFRNTDLLLKLESEFAHFVPLIDPGGYTFVTGTRYSHADIYGKIIKENRGQWMISERGAYDAAGTLLFSIRALASGRKIGFTRELLDEIQRDDPETFAAQYMNKIISGVREMFTDASVMAAVRAVGSPDYPKHGACYFAVDLAYGQGDRADSSVITVGRVDRSGRLTIVDCVGNTFTPAQLVVVILNLAVEYRPLAVYVEKSAGAEFFVEYLRKVAGDKSINLGVEAIKMSTKKDAKYLRIASLEGAIRDKKLFFGTGIRDFDKMLEEFTQFPKGRHDDRPDCIAILYSHLSTANMMASPVKRQVPWMSMVPGFDEFGDPSGDNSMIPGMTC